MIDRLLYNINGTLFYREGSISFSHFHIYIISFFSPETIFYFLIITLLHSCRPANDKPYVPTFQVSKEKAKSLGIEFIPLETSLKETVESLKEKNFANF